MQREHLSVTRNGITSKLKITGSKIIRIYFTIGVFEDGRPGELFVKIDKDCAEIDGSLKSWAIAVSMLLQSGWTVDDLFNKFAHIRHEPSGFTNNPAIPICKSPEDYIMQFMKGEYGTHADKM